MAEEKKRCSKTTKAGKPCTGYCVKGWDVCVSHLPKEEKAKRGFGGAENGAKGGEARRHPRFTEMLRAKVAEEVADFFEPYREALQATTAVVVGTGPNASVEIVPDYKTRLMAMEKLLDRLDGKPRQAMELTGADGGPIETRELIPSDDDFHTEVAMVLAEAEAIKSG